MIITIKHTQNNHLNQLIFIVLFEVLVKIYILKNIVTIMILTKDNLLRYVRDKKYVTPTTVAEAFETTTMIASAALSGLSKDKLIAITFLKLSSTPYYYDKNQPECLIEIGDKHLKNHEKEVFLKLKEQQIVNDASLTIAQRLAAERLQDFANLFEIEHQGRIMKFWIWYLRDLNDTQKQIRDALKGNEPKPEQKKEVEPRKVQPVPVKKVITESVKVEPEQKKVVQPQQPQTIPANNPFEVPVEEDTQESKVDKFIKNYFKQNYLKIDAQSNNDKYTKYKLSLKINSLILKIEAIYFFKKPTDTDVLRFYTSSNKPKIVFIENAAKKYFKLGESLDNLEIVNI